jgi:hypothetical protein
MALGFVAAGLMGLRVRARLIDRKLDREFPEKKE